MKLTKPIREACVLTCLILIQSVPLGHAWGQLIPAPEKLSTSTAAPSLSSHLSPEWLNSAKRIQTNQWTIYYKGSADGAYSEDKTRWVGKITGDVLALSEGGAIVLPEGTLNLGENGRVRAEGPHKTEMPKTPEVPWKHLLRRGLPGK